MNSSIIASDARLPLVLGVRVELSNTSPGYRELMPLADHRLRIHAGMPVRGACSAHRFVYTRGDIDIQPAGYSDVWHEFEPNTSLIVHFSQRLWRRAAEALELDPDHQRLEPEHQLRDSRVEHIAWALEAEQRSAHRNGSLFTESLGLALATHLLGRHKRSAPEATLAARPKGRGLSAPQLRRVLSFIEAHLDRDLSIGRLASEAALSASHFKTLFKRAMGVPIHQYVIHRRVERAKALLQSGESPASQVAIEVGFAHQSHMARAMRRVLGISPSELTRTPSPSASPPQRTCAR